MKKKSVTPPLLCKMGPPVSDSCTTTSALTGSFKRIKALCMLLVLTAFVFLAGCDIDSVDSTSAVLSNGDGTIFNFSGLYMNPQNDGSILPIVFPNEGNHKPTGEIITSLRLLQYGSVLEGYDSAGLTWYGSISTLQGTTATFSLSGRTTLGSSVEISGTMNYADQQSTLNATWIEPAYYGNIIATATVAPATTNSPATNLSISPGTASLNTNDVTQVFTAVGESGPYTWSGGSGNFSSNPGNPVTYTHDHSIGDSTITVTDANGDTATATVTYTGGGSSSLGITPGAYLLNSGSADSVPFTASGGTSPYSWEVSTDSLGTLSSTSGASVEYTSTKVNGKNTITVTDSLSATATATAEYQ